MMEICDFETALKSIQRLLNTEEKPTQVVWAFREDLYRTKDRTWKVRWPLPTENEPCMRNLYNAGRERGLVGLYALLQVERMSVVIVEVPELTEVQGWNGGLKLSIALPFLCGEKVSTGVRWNMHKLGFGYRRFQRYGNVARRRQS